MRGVVLNLKQKYVIASEKIWNENIHRSLNKNVDCEFILLSNRHDLNIDNLRTINPKIIFFPHWSYLIPEEIYAEFECVVFHIECGVLCFINLIICNCFRLKLVILMFIHPVCLKS